MSKLVEDCVVHALRTTKKVQGTTTFFDEQTGKYCALGVICEEVLHVPCLISGFWGKCGNYSAIREAGIISSSIFGLNDHHRLTFPEIADRLEQNPEYYFEPEVL